MKTVSLLMSLVMLGSGVAFAGKGHEHPSGGAAGVVEGEVLDMACYMAHEGKGKKHKKCAEMCIMGGVPIGLLTKDGSVFLLLEDHNKKEPYKALQQMAAEQARVSGMVVKKGGVQAIVVEKAEKAK